MSRMLIRAGRSGPGCQGGAPLAGIACLLALLTLMGIQAAAEDLPTADNRLGEPGYLVIEAAADSTAGFRWENGPGPGRRSLVWDQGRLILPDTLMTDHIGSHDLGVYCTARLAGGGASGQIVLRDGIYPVSEPVVLSDGLLELKVSGGELEFRGARIRYRRTMSGLGDSKAGLLLLAGMTLMVIVLLRRVRLKAGERTGT